MISNKKGEGLNKLVEIMNTLRGKDGCPWDKEQTLESLKQYMLEETYEVFEALDKNDIEEHKEELGDVLLQIVFQARLRDEKNEFDIEDVISTICEKLVRRHPHIFGDVKVKDSKEVMSNWMKIKKTEKKEYKSALDGVPKALPGLIKSYRLQEKASRVGFDWPDVSGVKQKIKEELSELEEAVKSNKTEDIEHELGDVLFAIVNYARFLNIQPESALQKCNNRFVNRFSFIESKMDEENRKFEETDIDYLEKLWQMAKKNNL